MKLLGNKKLKDQLGHAIKQDIPVLLIGQTGCGKTSLIRELATEHKAEMVRFNMTGETSVDDFVGHIELKDQQTKWRDGILLTAMKRGHWLLVDEVNMALQEILTVLQSLLDDDRMVMSATTGEVVKPHKNFRFFATMNPVEEYAGTKDLNKAFASRFGMVIEMDYPDAKTEAKIVEAKGLDKDQAAQIADVGLALRKAKADGKILFPCSTRDLLHWAALTPSLGLQDAFEVTIVAKSMGDGAEVVNVYQSVIGRWEAAKADLEQTQLIDFIEAEAKRIKNEKDQIKLEVMQELYEKLKINEAPATV